VAKKEGSFFVFCTLRDAQKEEEEEEEAHRKKNKKQRDGEEKRKRAFLRFERASNRRNSFFCLFRECAHFRFLSSYFLVGVCATHSRELQVKKTQKFSSLCSKKKAAATHAFFRSRFCAQKKYPR